MTRYTTIDNKRISHGTMSPKSTKAYCERNKLVRPPVCAVIITADYAHSRAFNWETNQFETIGQDSDMIGHMLGI